MSFNFFVILAVCWLMIFDEQICMNQAEPIPPGAEVRIVKNETGTHLILTASIPPKTLPACLPLDDYHDFGPLGIYKLHHKATTWADARMICREEGAHLAIINSKAEATVLSSMLNRMENVPDAALQQTVFLGIHNLFEKGEWVTVLDDPIDATCYTNWTKNCCGSNLTENCGTLRKDGTLDAAPCDCKLPFFCKKPYPYPRGKCC